MSKPLRIILDFLSYEGTLTNNPQDATAIKRKVEEASVDEVTRFQKKVPAATVDMVIDLPDATTDYLLIFIDQQVSVKLNSSATAQILKPKAAGTKTPVLYIRGDVTGMTISNAGAVEANIDVIAVNI